MSDDSSSSVDNVGLLSRDRGTSSLQLSDSDLDTPHMATMVRQGRSRTKRGRGDIIGIESDSFTENVQPWQDFRVHTKRRRKFKRMALGPDVVMSSAVRGVTATKRKKVRSRSGYDGRSLDPKTSGGITPGKRKRSAREKSVESGDILGGASGSGRTRTVSLGDNNERMELEEEEDSSSSLSSSEWEDVDNCPEGEADDEQSDWPGHDPGLTDDELDTEISFNNRKLVGSGRVMRAGSRRLKSSSNRAPPYSDMIHKFIQDSSLQSLRLTCVRSADRNMILGLARLYSLTANVELATVTLSKPRRHGGHGHGVMESEPCHGDTFAVPGVPQIRQYRDSKDGNNKKQRKYGPVPPGGGGDNHVLGVPGPSGNNGGMTTRQHTAAATKYR